MEIPIRMAMPVGVFTGICLFSSDAIEMTTGAIWPINAPSTISGNRNSKPPMAVVLRKLMKRFDFLTIMSAAQVRFSGSEYTFTVI